MTTFDQRTAAVSKIWRDNRWLYMLMGFGLGVLALPALQMINNDTLDLLTGLVPEAVGIVFTVLIIERFARVRAERELKEQLFFQLGSEDNSTALNALSLLKHKGWIYRDSLRGIKLPDANLAGAKLEKLNLSGADLRRSRLNNADLRGADLFDVDLREAILESADLSVANVAGANFSYANLSAALLVQTKVSGVNLSYTNLSAATLRGADLSNSSFLVSHLSDADLSYANISRSNLSRANLSGANLFNANLSGANLFDTSLSGVDLRETKFDKNTVLPDAKRRGKNDDGDHNYDKYWTPETDMSRYTEPNHPDFWQPKWSAAGFDSADEWGHAGFPNP